MFVLYSLTGGGFFFPKKVHAPPLPISNGVPLSLTVESLSIFLCSFHYGTDFSDRAIHDCGIATTMEETYVPNLPMQMLIQVMLSDALTNPLTRRREE